MPAPDLDVNCLRILGPLEFRITLKTHLYKNRFRLIYFIKLDLNVIDMYQRFKALKFLRILLLKTHKKHKADLKLYT